MADSVGKIQLDIEITPNSIAREMGTINKAFSSGLQGMFGNLRSFAKNTIGDIAGQIRKVAGVKDEILPDVDAEEMSAKFGGSLKRMEERMASLRASTDKTNAKIQELKTSMGELFAEQDAIARGYAEMPPIGGLTKDESMEKLLASDTRYRKLSAEIEALELRIQSLGNRNKQAAGEMETLGRAMDRVKESTSQASGANEQLGRSSSRAGQITERAGRQFSNAGDRAKKSTGKVVGFATSMQRAFMRVLRQVFIITVMYEAIRGMIEYTGAALKTNQAFMRSLNQVKTNLQVAFMPIYQAILPALNTFMAWLAKATAYIASFTSALFGKTYKQSFQAAKGLNAAKKSLEGTGKAAKKAAGSLAAFDEINILSEPQEEEGEGSDLTAPSMDMDAVDQDMGGLADKFKSMLASLWQPFKDAWENEGAATVEAARYALDGIWTLVKEIGESFAIVWTNGTGQAILEALLRILQQIFGLVGDIAFTFAGAWAEGGRGTAIVQGIANVFLHLLELVERIGISLRNVWGDVGATVARVFLEIIQATVGVLENLAEKLVWVWDHGGQHLFESLIKLGAKIFELAGYIYTNFVTPFINWFVDMISPAVAGVLDWVGWLLDKFIELIDWLMGDGKPVLDTIVTVLGSMALAFGIVKLATIAYQGVLTGLRGVMGAVQLASSIMQKGLLASLGPFNLVVLAIGALIAIGVLLYKNWDEISTFLKNLWNDVKTQAITIFNAIKDAITGAFDSAKTTVLGIWNALVTTLSGVWNGIKSTASTVFNTVKNTITSVTNAIRNTVLNIWNTITSRLTGAFNTIYSSATGIFGKLEGFISGVCNSISGFFKGMVNGVIRALNGMIGGLNRLKFDVPDWVPGLGGKKFGFDIPKIPQLARGGIVDQPTLAMIGEKRKKEAVVPLEDTSFVDKLAEAVASAVLSVMQMLMNGQNQGSQMPREFIIEIDGKKLVRIILPELNSELMRRGARPIIQPV